MPDWDESDWARFLICLFIGLVILAVGIDTIRNPSVFYDPIVGIIEIGVGLFFVGIGISPDDTFNFFESILNFLRDLAPR